MIFSTYKFIFLFLPIVFSVFFLLSKQRYITAAKIWLVMASLFFYGQGSLDFFLFFLGSILGNFIIGNRMSAIQGQNLMRKLLFAIGLAGNIILLGYFKYVDFFIENYNFVTGSDYTLKYIILPIGISFFTFQLIAFLVDSYRGETKEYSLLNYLLFITFFPQLIVGPIIHHGEAVPQFDNENTYILNFDNISKGLFLFSIGCAKKLLIADPLTTDAQLFFGDIMSNLSLLDTWFHSIQYTISYYFDLSGYADMAVGLGLMFNIHLPQNFDSPYKASNFKEYWQRWHITLSKFLGAYVFKSVYKKNSKWRNYYVATMITFLVSGFWHGAGWTFVLWGVLNGVFVCIAAWQIRRAKAMPFIPAFIITQLGVVLLRVLFVSTSFQDAYYVYLGMLNVNSLGTSVSSIASNIKYFISVNKELGFLLTVGILISWFAPNTKTMEELFTTNVKNLVYASMLLIMCIMQMNKVVQFLYFQF